MKWYDSVLGGGYWSGEIGDTAAKGRTDGLAPTWADAPCLLPSRGSLHSTLSLRHSIR